MMLRTPPAATLTMMTTTAEEPCSLNDDDSSASSDSDISSLHSFGSIRPDPNYDPARDPMNPINPQQPFVPPREISVQTIRSRRRNRMERNDDDAAVAAVTALRLLPLLPTALLTDGMSSEMFISDTFHNDHIYRTNSLIIDDENDDDDDNEEIAEVVQQQHHQQQRRQRKGMVRREFGRRIFALKKKARYYHRRDYSGNTNSNSSESISSHTVIHGDTIDRVFGGVVVANKENTTPYIHPNNGSSNDNHIDNHHTKSTPTSWQTNLFTTKSRCTKQQGGQGQHFSTRAAWGSNVLQHFLRLFFLKKSNIN